MLSKIYAVFILVCFLFFFGAIMGWVLELFFRRFISSANPDRLWLNPGFLTGPYLPLYGFGVVVLYALSYLEKFIVQFDHGGLLHYMIMFVIMASAMTLVEYIAGIIFIKGMHIKLWDYSNEKGNIQGVICPRFTVIWGVLSLLYYFFLYPPITKMIMWFMNHQLFSFTVGTVFGVFMIDFATSLHLGTILRKKAVELDEKPIIDFDKFKIHSGKRFFSIYNKRNVSERLDEFENFIKRSPDTLK
ncbi:MAG: putative ABC transporter permease [Treponema sp.]|nr:putative ABC transporter permease [Treponema sp.]